MHRGVETRDCWSAPAGPAHECETGRSDHHRDPGTGSGRPQASDNSRAARGLWAVRILLPESRNLVPRRGLSCCCWKISNHEQGSLCTLASQRCYATPFRLDAPLPMGSITPIRNILHPWVAPSDMVRWGPQAQSHPEFRLGEAWGNRVICSWIGTPGPIRFLRFPMAPTSNSRAAAAQLMFSALLEPDK